MEVQATTPISSKIYRQNGLSVPALTRRINQRYNIYIYIYYLDSHGKPVRCPEGLPMSRKSYKTVVK